MGGAGFAALMATFTLLLIFMLTLSDSPAALLVALILTQSSMVWGCQFATYLYPNLLFPEEVRSTFHGLPSFFGKVGAAVGVYLFKPVQQAFGEETQHDKDIGDDVVIGIQIGVATLGLLLTIFVLQTPPPDGQEVLLTPTAKNSTGAADFSLPDAKENDADTISVATTAPAEKNDMPMEMEMVRMQEPQTIESPVVVQKNGDES